MNSSKNIPSDLVVAVTAFDDELARFGRLTEAARKAPLNSQKNLQRAARVFQDIAEAEGSLAEAGGALSRALTAARQTQEAQANSLRELADQFTERSALAAELLGAYADLGQRAANLNQRMQDLAANRLEGASPDEVRTAFTAMAGELGEVAERAATLAGKSREADFMDIARQVDSLAQQASALESKLLSLEVSLRPH
jgi:chromosome segregation ATPase